MTSYRSRAREIGGRFLAESMSRRVFWFARWRRQTLEEVRRAAMAGEDMGLLSDEVQVPSFLVDDPNTMTEQALDLLRDEFYAICNMTPLLLSKWVRDPRVGDGVGPHRPRAMATLARRRLRNLQAIRTTARRDGTGWTRTYYETAQECVFVAGALFHPRVIDYQTWVILQNFGCRWDKPSFARPFKRLPRSVRAEADIALMLHRNPAAGIML